MLESVDELNISGWDVGTDIIKVTTLFVCRNSLGITGAKWKCFSRKSLFFIPILFRSPATITKESLSMKKILVKIKESCLSVISAISESLGGV